MALPSILSGRSGSEPTFEEIGDFQASEANTNDKNTVEVLSGGLKIAILLLILEQNPLGGRRIANPQFKPYN